MNSISSLFSRVIGFFKKEEKEEKEITISDDIHSTYEFIDDPTARKVRKVKEEEENKIIKNNIIKNKTANIRKQKELK